MDDKYESINKRLGELQSDQRVQSAEVRAEMRGIMSLIAQLTASNEASSLALSKSVDNLTRTIDTNRTEHNVKLEKNEGRITELEKAQAATDVRIGLWGGLAGIVALIWQGVTLVWK